MKINLILIPFVIILGLLFAGNDCRRNRGLYIFFCCAVFIFVAAMRSPEWMTYTYHIDTLNYKYYFENSIDLSWNEIFSSTHLRYFGYGGEMDVGFVVLNKIVSYFTNDFFIYSIIVDLLFFIPFGVILYRYTTNINQIVFAFVFYISLIQTLVFGGGRQNFALGFDLMALLSIIDRKRLLAVLLFLIGVTIHFSSLLFMVPLLMIWYDVRPKTLKFLHYFCFLLFPVALFMPNELIVFMGNLVGMEKYAAYGKGVINGGAWTFTILTELLSLFCLIAIKKKDMTHSNTLRNFYVMTPWLTLFAPLIHSNGAMIRVSLYYHLFLVLLVPYSIDCMFSKSKRGVIYVIAIGSLAILTLANGGLTYYFFWQR